MTENRCEDDFPVTTRCAEGLCVVSVNGPKIKRWLRAFPSVLNETGDRPAIKREFGQFG
ncbi:hypothetical protein CLD27_05830 [Escherichia coli]|nr:hypothetical protein CLD27_05830 [Escherichia coli]ATG64618.1 hypothetical protein AWA97_25910 [Escherichia coli O104:H21 str. CFSAN002236]